jgi:molybdate transport system substrate-binding protein
MKKRCVICLIILLIVIGFLEGCGVGNSEERKTSGKETELQVFVAASLSNVMTELTKAYQEAHPDVKVILNADSSGKLLTQIEEGYECDIFFSAAQKQMDQLETDGLITKGSRDDVVNNRLVVITRKNSGTKVTGLLNLKDANSLALAEGSVPAGRYTRQALVSLGILKETEDASKFTTREVSEALGGLEVSEQGNVSKVLIAVIEGSCEVGTIYYSDTYGYEEQIDIIEQVDYDLTGDIIYPICIVKNPEATDEKEKETEKFYQYILSEEAKLVFEQYYFDRLIE